MIELSGEVPSLTVTKNLLIPTRDGVRLAADWYSTKPSARLPVLFHLIPYHKDGMSGRGYIEVVNRYFAQHGYHALTVDIRGLGNSEGKNRTPFDPQEGLDGHDAVEWLAQQAWCDGSVGVWGVSYGGHTALKIAANQPPHLKAIIPIQGFVDAYRDFVYPGGVPELFGVSGAWGPRMIAYNLTPPLYRDPEGRWMTVWREHLEGNEPWLLAWWSHPEYDSFWEERAVQLDQVRAASFIIGSWRDIFPEAMLRAYVEIPAPKKLLMGPWMHGLPDMSFFRPVNVMHEMLRWFDYWLKGRTTGIDDEPPVAIFVEGSDTWRCEREWPPARTLVQTFFLGGDGTCGTERNQQVGMSRQYRVDPTVGTEALLWDPLTLGFGLPREQSADDFKSLVYTSAPFPGGLEIVGSAEAVLYVKGALAGVHLAVKLADVFPDGRSINIASGWLRVPEDRPESEEARAGSVVEVRVPVWAAARVLAPGHRLRVTVACADFPRIWPGPSDDAITIEHGGRFASRVLVPTLVGSGPELPPPTLQPPEHDLKPPALVHRDGSWRIIHDQRNRAIVVEGGQELVQRLDQETTMRLNHGWSVRSGASHSDQAHAEAETELRVEGAPHTTIVRTGSSMGLHDLVITTEVKVGDEVVYQRQWRHDRSGLQPCASSQSGG